jgi:hypothetical protein
MPIHFHEFSVALIDGDHGPAAPYRDFANLKDRTTDYLLFDNAESQYVSDTIEKVLDEEPWEEYKSVEYTSTFKKKFIYDDDKIVKFTILRRIS